MADVRIRGTVWREPGFVDRWTEREARTLNADLVTARKSLSHLLAETAPACVTRGGDPWPIDRAVLERIAARCGPGEAEALRLPIRLHFSGELEDACYLTDPVAGGGGGPAGGAPVSGGTGIPPDAIRRYVRTNAAENTSRHARSRNRAGSSAYPSPAKNAASTAFRATASAQSASIHTQPAASPARPGTTNARTPVRESRRPRSSCRSNPRKRVPRTVRTDRAKAHRREDLNIHTTPTGSAPCANSIA